RPMSLEATLETMRERSRSYVPEEARAVMGRATADLRASGILDRYPKVGESAPDFTLENTRGVEVSSADLRADSALVVTFYRGFW
ncbi:MAG: AhpC/TSA family protein, partial [Acidobacteriota bacterium]